MKRWSLTSESLTELLRNRTIGRDGPGSILRDFRTLLDFVGTSGLRTSSHRANLPAAVLRDLNGRMSDPVVLFLNRALLQDYPNLAGLYALARALALVGVDRGWVRVDASRRAQWESLNATEQYFTLLDVWLRLAGGATAEGHSSEWRFHQLRGNLRFLVQVVSARWKTFDEWCHVGCMRDGVPAWNIQLQALFGFIEVRPRPLAGRQESSRAWGMAAARRTPWGEAVGWALVQFFGIRNEEGFYDLQTPEEAGLGFLYPAFQPYFPELQRRLTEPETPMQPGCHLFKVILDPRRHGRGPWHRLAVPHEASLGALAYAVLEAFAFQDTDHLYEFSYRDNRGTRRLYYHPYTEEGPYADDIAVGETGLPLRETMRFRFDFGDNWRFLLRLEAIEPLAAGSGRKIELRESQGENPRQYPYAY